MGPWPLQLGLYHVRTALLVAVPRELQHVNHVLQGVTTQTEGSAYRVLQGSILLAKGPPNVPNACLVPFSH